MVFYYFYSDVGSDPEISKVRSAVRHRSRSAFSRSLIQSEPGAYIDMSLFLLRERSNMALRTAISSVIPI